MNAPIQPCPACGEPVGEDATHCPHCGSSVSGAADPVLGQVIAGNYRVDSLVGEGAMGRVYRATQLSLKKSFAIKILAPHLTHDEASHARFANEAHNLASLNHPNCVSVVDYGRTDDGLTYIVMEFIRGLTLERVIEEQFPLPQHRIIDLTLQVLAALAEAHGLGILHRDLKPENIVVQSLRTHGELAKVLDFGIAKLMDSASELEHRAGLTMKGTVCGTPEYMSPEQARGHTLDERADLYSVGAILYQMMTGRPPFEAPSAVEVLHKQLHEAPVPPHQLLGTTPTTLDTLCLKALAKSRDERFTTAAEFRDALVGTTAETSTGSACSSCGHLMSTSDRFCAACGAPAPVKPQTFARRRPTTRPSSEGGRRRRSTERTAELWVRNFPPPIVGRDHLLQKADELLANPTPGVTVRPLSAAPGLGKTRLADEIAAKAERAGWRVSYAGADPSGAKAALWPIQQVVADLLDFDPSTITTHDLGRAANLSGLAFEELPGLAELFRLQGPAHNMEFQVRRRECFASAVQALQTGGRGRPLLLVFDDIDRYDNPSRQIVKLLANAEANTPILCIVTTTETTVGWLGDSIEQIGHLETHDVRNCLEQLGTPPEDSVLLEEVIKYAPLSPLKLEHTLRILASGEEPTASGSEHDLIRQQLELLPPESRRLIEAASSLGERFAEADLFDLVEGQPGYPAGRALDEALADLHTRGLLFICGRAERAFTHTAVRDAAYAAISAESRRELHLRAAATSRRAQASVATRALHLLAGRSEDAVHALEAAAADAEKSFDDRAAVEYLRAALGAAGRLADADRARTHRATLTARLGELLRERDDAPKAIELLREQLKEQVDAREELGLLTVLGRQYFRSQHLDKAVASLQQALPAAIASGDRSSILDIYGTLGDVYAAWGDTERAIAELQEGLDMCTLGEGGRAEIDLELWRYLLGAAEILRAYNESDDARRWCEDALFQAERRNDRLGMLRAHCKMAWVLTELEQGALAEHHVSRALEHARYFGDRLTTAELLMSRARVRAARGRHADAIRLFEEAQRLARVIGWASGVQHSTHALEALEQTSGDSSTSLAKPPTSF